MALAGTAYLVWGVFPAFFRLLRGTDPVRVLAHRGLWAGAIAALLLIALRRRELARWWRSPERGRQLGALGLSAALLASNWGVYVHTIQSGRVLQASLGYFICPLLMVGLGVAFLGERPSRGQWAALAVAALGVVALALGAAELPWLALYLAASFAAYGVLRKKLALDPLLASAIEALVMVPFAAGYLGLVRPEPLLAATSESALLVASGAVTVAPLMLFAAGAKRLPHFTLGLLQYVTPSLSLLLALFAYREPLGRPQAMAFALIWAALVLSSLELGWRAWMGRRVLQARVVKDSASPSALSAM